MAAGFLQHFAGDWVEIRSLGSAEMKLLGPQLFSSRYIAQILAPSIEARAILNGN